MKWHPLFSICLISLASFSLPAQDSLNMEKLFQWDDDDLPLRRGGAFSDCWGYVDDEGNEYAILGAIQKIFFFDITDPENTVLIDEFGDGSPAGLDLDPTTWRDFKVYGEKAYAVADEGNEGLIVFDLSGLPDTVIWEEQNTSFFDRSHNLFIDTASGYLYTAGANTELGGTIILDLNNDPITEVASVTLNGGYIHDLHVRNDTAYCNSGNDGLYIFDFTTPASPAFLGSLETYNNQGYNHSGWLNDAGTHLIFCDENLGRQVKICDVTDPLDMSVTDFFYSNLENSNPVGSMAHNPFVLGDFVYLAYYHDGIHVFDISDPTNVISHAYYDTSPGNTGYSGFVGAWGVYPYYPSGSIIVSDDLNGLFVLRLVEEALPVELQDFTLEQKLGEVWLNWLTASEENSASYEIERSTDGVHFTSIGSVLALGTTAEKSSYQLIDQTPLIGVNYYRLKMLDLDGKFEYSKILSTEILGKQVIIAPTLVKAEHQSIKIQSRDKRPVRVELIDASGRSIQRFTSKSNKIEIPVAYLPNGTYSIHLDGENWQQSEKIIIAR